MCHNSKECQVQHWKQHKSTCTKIKTKHDKWKKAMNNVLPDGTVNDTKEGPCAICLEETITNPVVMPCGHVFCFSFVGKYQQSSTSKERASCPVADKALDRSIFDMVIEQLRHQKDQRIKRNMQSLLLLSLIPSLALSILRIKNFK